MNSYQVRSYCCRENLFTCGSVDQYNKMFATEDIHDKAVIIWICSKTTKSIKDIENDLIALSKEDF